MQFRAFSLFLLIIVATSCEYFNLNKNSQLIEVDTIIDFSSVDVSPSFAVCDSIIEKKAKTNCFRTNIHKHVSESLAKHHIEVKQPIDEAILVEVLISKKGLVTVNAIKSSELVKSVIPNLDSIIEVSLKSLPSLFPATKKGILVTTQYQIPIQIVVN